MDATEQKVYDALKKSGKPMSAAQVAEAAGLSKDEVSKAFKKLKNAGKITSPKACYYAPA